MKRILNILGTGVIIFLVVTGVFIEEREFIPDNARVLAIKEYKIWIPNSDWANEIFSEQALRDINAQRSYENRIETTYLEIKEGQYKGYQLPEPWLENDGKSRIVWGKVQSKLRSWLLPKENRWNEDGSWNW